VVSVKFLAFVYGNEEIWQGEGIDFPTLVAEVDAFNARHKASGELVEVHGLETNPRSIRNGKAQFTDGPYLEAKEFVGSYFLLDVPSQERAEQIVADYPGLRHGSGGGLELWPLMVFPEG
jgi:hypothetical protein